MEDECEKSPFLDPCLRHVKRATSSAAVRGRPVGQNPRNTMHFREIFYRTVNACTSLVMV